MGTFMVLLITWILGGLVINFLCRLLVRTKLQPYMKISDFDDYQKGFGAGVTNLKMYYYSTGKIPPIEWLQANMSTVLNTREKLEATLSEEEKKLSYTSEPQG